MVDEERFPFRFLAIPVVENEFEFDIGAVGIQPKLFLGLWRVRPPLEAGFALVGHEPDVGEPVSTVLQVGV